MHGHCICEGGAVAALDAIFVPGAGEEGGEQKMPTLLW